MQLTRAADYAVRVMIHLAVVPSGVCASRDALAEMTEVPPEFLGKVLQALARSDLVTSRRGARGGYSLARDGAAITMLDVVEAIEGPLHLNLCLQSGQACGRSPWCAAHTVWARAQSALAQVLASASIDDLARQSAVARRAWGLSPVSSERNG